MKSAISTIYLSPHYDDAVLSCGGLIRAQADTRNVKVFTVFGSPLNHRTDEDKRAVRFLRATQVIGPYREALYRHGFDPTCVLDNTLDMGFPSNVYSSDRDIPTEMEFSELLGHEIYCPLGIGGHVDHVMVRRLASMHALDVRYWEDAPYCFTRDPDPWVIGLVPTVIPMDPNGVTFSLWMQAITRYKSQVRGLCGDYHNMVSQYTQYIKQHGGIRIWSKA